MLICSLRETSGVGLKRLNVRSVPRDFVNVDELAAVADSQDLDDRADAIEDTVRTEDEFTRVMRSEFRDDTSALRELGELLDRLEDLDGPANRGLTVVLGDVEPDLTHTRPSAVSDHSTLTRRVP